MRSLSHAAEGEQSLARGPPAFVFDIDGVLIRGRHTLPQAQRALAKLYTSDGSRPRYPICFLTNGGGVTERFKAHQLSEWLGVAVDESQVVLSHTPFRQLVGQFGNQPVLVSGRGQVWEVAHHYGLRQVVTPRQLVRHMPAAVPFHEDQGLFPGGDLPVYTRELKYGSPQHPIKAIFVFTDPSDWYRDLQLMVDVLTSGGAPGHTCLPGTPPPEVFFSNPDLLWANEFPQPRFGQGAFSACLETLYEKVTGKPLKAHHFGKPHAAPYLLAEQLLLAQAQALGLELPEGPEAAPSSSGGSSMQHARMPLPFSGIFAVGDNPAADVRGANAAGAPWVSVLVIKTGVARANCSRDPAQLVVDNVEAAVDAALHRTRHARWHSMR
ncbi:hypothetical protein ABPG75_003224 [Micractinium tetrahymenae]